MKAFRVFVTIVLVSSPFVLSGQTKNDSIDKLEAAGDMAGARAALAKAAEASPDSLPAVARYAEFLERFGDPSARDSYNKLLTLATRSGDKKRAASTARRLVVLDLLAGDHNAASSHLDALRPACGPSPPLSG